LAAGPIGKTLSNLGEPREPAGVSPAREPPVDWGDLVQSFGDGEIEQASPDDLPMNDIHHRQEPVAHPSRRVIVLPH